MKKIETIIVLLLCVVINVTASPIHVSSTMTYSSTYKGSGHAYIHTTSSAQVHSIGSAGGSLAQAPVASMRSTSRGISSTTASVSVPRVACISTSASSIQGGVTTGQVCTLHHHGTPRQSAWPGGNPPGCDCDWQYDPSLFGGQGGYYCPKCGATISKEDYYDLEEGESPHGDDPCGCAVPLQDGIDVWAFVAALAGAYALYKARARIEQLI